MAIVAATFRDPAERARAIGGFGAMSGLSLALGPIVGGLLVDGAGWHLIFWINVPIAAGAIVCAALFVPESRAARARRVDPVGQTLVALVLGGLVNPPITNTAVSGMPDSMAGVAASLASVGRQTGTALGVAIAGTVVASAGQTGAAFTTAERGVWWMIAVLGIAVVGLAILSTGPRARRTAERSAAQF